MCLILINDNTEKRGSSEAPEVSSVLYRALERASEVFGSSLDTIGLFIFCVSVNVESAGSAWSDGVSADVRLANSIVESRGGIVRLKEYRRIT